MPRRAVAPPPSAYQRALRRLARRDHSVAELRRALLERGHDAVEVEAALERLRGERYLDDAGFAERFARSRLAHQGLGRLRIRQGLRQRGVDRGLADRRAGHGRSPARRDRRRLARGRLSGGAARTPIEMAADPDVMLVWPMNGEDLPAPNGGPVRLLVPGWGGIASTKWIVGHVFDGGGTPLSNTTVTMPGAPLPTAFTDSGGYYTIPDVPQGEYDVQALMGRCTDAQTQHVVLSSNITLDFILNVREDTFGYHCQIIPMDWVEGTNVLPLTGTGNSTSVGLPFKFSLYGQEYQTAYVSSSGFLNFLRNNYAFYNDYIPTTYEPNAAIYPFWDELWVMGGDSVIKTETVGTAPNRIWVLESS